DASRLAGRRPGGRRDRRDVATFGRDSDDPDLAPSLTRGTRRGRRGGDVFAAAGYSSGAGRCPLGRLTGQMESLEGWTLDEAAIIDYIRKTYPDADILTAGSGHSSRSIPTSIGRTSRHLSRATTTTRPRTSADPEFT